MEKRIILTILSVFIYFLSIAATNTWTNNNGSGDGKWNTASNWSLGTLPAATDDIVFTGTYNYNCVYNPAIATTVNSFSVDASYSAAIDASSGSGGTDKRLTVSGLTTISGGTIIGYNGGASGNGWWHQGGLTMNGGNYQPSVALLTFGTSTNSVSCIFNGGNFDPRTGLIKIFQNCTITNNTTSAISFYDLQYLNSGAASGIANS